MRGVTDFDRKSLLCCVKTTNMSCLQGIRFTVWLVVQVFVIKLIWMESHKLAAVKQQLPSNATNSGPMKKLSSTFCNNIFTSCTIMGEAFNVRTQPLCNHSGQAVALIVSSPSNYKERDVIRGQIRQFNLQHSLGLAYR